MIRLIYYCEIHGYFQDESMIAYLNKDAERELDEWLSERDYYYGHTGDFNCRFELAIDLGNPQ